MSDAKFKSSDVVMIGSNNLSDLSNAGTSRTNLGLGTLATQSGTFSGTSSGANTGDQTLSSLGLLSGTGTLSSGTLTINAAITANSRIIVTAKDANPGAGGLTIGFEAPIASRNVGAGTFVVRANVAAGTINVLDTSTFDWFVVN